MLVKQIFSQRLFAFILFCLLGLITFLGIQSLSVKATLATDRVRTEVLNTNSIVEKAKALYEAGQFSEAAKIWQQAANEFAAAGDKLNQASALSNLSLTYQQLGLWNEAKNAIANSLSLLNTDSSPLILAQILNIQGFLELSLGQPENALDTLKKAAAAYEKAGDRAGIIANLINQSQAMQALGFYRRAANILEQVETNLLASPDSIIKVTGLLNLGNTLRVVGNLDKSQQVLQQGLEIAQKLGLKGVAASIQLSLGNTKRALAKKFVVLNRIENAQVETQSALELYRQAATSQSRNTRIQALINQLSLLVENRQNSDAQALLPTIQQELKELPASRTSVYARINLAQSLVKQSAVNSNPQLITEIAQILAKAVQEAKNLEDRRAESLALGTLGGLYESNQQFSNAQTVTQQALILAQAIDGSDIAYRWQWQLGRVLKAQGEKEGAIAVYTEAVKTLKSLRSDLTAINQEVQFSFRETVEPVYRQLVELLLQNGDNINQNNLIQARNLIESLQLAELDNFFQEACLTAKPELIDQVDKTAAVIYPIILSDRLDVILSLPQQPLRHYSTNLPQKQIEETLEQLRQMLGRPSSSRRQILQVAQQIYDWLIRPGATEIKNSGVKTLVFVLDGVLRNIPMAVLYDGNQHLLQQYNVAVAPGLQLLEPQSLGQVQLKALMLGLSESRDGFPPLPAVEKELQQIQQVVPGTVLLNQQFTGENLREQINSVPYPVVHLATHGKFSSSADNTFILTWDSRINVKQLDGFLRVRTQARGQAIELLVLSACETATGDRRATLGIAGVAVRAGARSTLATLWPVQDLATATMMAGFYKELANHGKAEALRRAQISLSQNFKHPYYWAPFVLVGNWL